MSVNKNDSSSSDAGVSYSSVQKTKNVKEIYSGSDVSKLLDNSKLLIHAVKLGNEILVRKLLDHGIPQYISDQLGCNPLYYAARYNHVAIIKILMDAGGEVNVFTKMKRTPLQIAAYHGHLEIVEIFIQNNADVNSVDLLGMSALHWAAENNHLETVKVLLKAGADRTIVNKFGKTARLLAFVKNHYETYELLKDWNDSEYSVNQNSPSDDVEQCASKQLTAVFIPENGAEISEPTPMAKRFLHGELQNQIRLDSSLKIHDNENETIKLIEQHRMNLLPAEQSAIIADADKRGQTAPLTDVEKLTLDKTTPKFIHQIMNSSENESQKSSKSSVNGMKIDRNLKTNDCSETGVQFKRKITGEENTSKTKIIKIDAQQLVNLTANKKLIIRPAGVNAVTKTFIKPYLDNRLTSYNTSQQYSNSELKENSTVVNSTASNMATELNKKTLLIKYMKKQLEMSMCLAKHYKTKYEVKEREALLYKTQLLNLTKMLSKPGIKAAEIVKS